jgi:diguanylate cyclase (GGDEF)-like protein
MDSLLSFHIFINALGFILSPLLPAVLALLNDKKVFLNNIFLLIPLFLNTIICILTIETGWVFFFDSLHEYNRGELFLIPTICSMFYYWIFIRYFWRNDSLYDSNEKRYLKLIFLMPVLATILQISFDKLLLIWPSIAVSLLLFYIYLREQQFKIDFISGIKNRVAFEKEIESICKNQCSDAAIVVFDLNNLKKINDTVGHKAGDDLINISAKVLTESFKGVGNSYRIGGDEFCVICKNVTKEIVENSLLKLEQISNEVNKKNSNSLIFAYGYELYEKDKNLDIYDIFHKADQKMYEHKAKLKGFYGRRVTDN